MNKRKHLLLLAVILVLALFAGCAALTDASPDVSALTATAEQLDASPPVSVQTATAEPPDASPTVSVQTATTSASDDELQKLFDEQKSDVAVSGKGTVLRLLSDDTDGDKHQRFIIELESGQTLMLVHNIDIAPRVEPLEVGDAVAFYGEYVWNDQGGLIHWTHHDPDGSHADGYIKANGKTFQ